MLQQSFSTRKQVRRGHGLVIRAAVFDQLTTSLEQVWGKLKNEGEDGRIFCLLTYYDAFGWPHHGHNVDLNFTILVADTLTRDNIKEPMKEIRRALLEADVGGVR